LAAQYGKAPHGKARRGETVRQAGKRLNDEAGRSLN